MKVNSVSAKVFSNLVLQLFPIIISLVFIPLSIQLLGKSNWAKLTLGISVIFLSNYVSFGIGPTLTRRISSLWKNKQKLFRKEFEFAFYGVKMLSSIVFTIVLVVLVTLFLTEKYSLIKNYADLLFFIQCLICFIITFLIIPYRSGLEGLGDFHFLGIYRSIITSLLVLLPYITFLVLDASLLVVGFMLILTYILAFFVLKKRLRSQIGIRLKQERKNKISLKNSFFRESVQFGVFSLLNYIIVFSPRIIYPFNYSSIIVSDFVTLEDLFNRITILTGTISLIYFQVFSEYDLIKSETKKKVKRLLKRKIFLIFSILIVIVSSKRIVGWFISIWLGTDYSVFMEDNYYLLMVGLVCFNLNILLMRPLQAMGYEKIVNYIVGVAALLFLIGVIVMMYFQLINYHYLLLMFISLGIFSSLIWYTIKQKLI
ncbi:MAG: hypothetical protein OIF50_07650 [Flavobacteriaceae bacterium]|nr:hypothetical protein [Flavobacteriaceae bacterium]